MGPDAVIFWILLSVISAVASLAVVTWALVRLPEDYFAEDRRPAWRAPSHLGHVLLIVGKNAFGLLLVALGVVLAIPGVPGQGLLTILVGFLVLDFPGKYRLERGLFRRGPVLRGANRIRARFGRPPFRA